MLINNNEYKLILLDTNAISNITKNVDELGKKFFENVYLKYNGIICFTPENMLELEKATNANEKFMEMFSTIPSLLLTTHKSICEQEAQKYVFGGQVNPIIIGFSNLQNTLTFSTLLNKFQNDHDLRKIIDKEAEGHVKVLQEWKNQRNTIQKFVTDNRYNIKQKNELLNRIYRDRIRETLLKDIRIYNPTFNEKEIDYEMFPAIRLSEFCHFEKVYRSSKPLGINDVSDVIICAVVPYVDIVITEKFQANLFEQAKHNIAKMKNVQVLTLKNIKEN